MTVTVRDLFCGAGGSSLGAELAGTELKHAINHWERAIETHARNFQHADHSCNDIASLTTAQIRRFEPTDILWGSPECTNHSLAKGGRRRKPQGARCSTTVPPATPNRTDHAPPCGTSSGSPSRRT